MTAAEIEGRMESDSNLSLPSLGFRATSPNMNYHHFVPTATFPQASRSCASNVRQDLHLIKTDNAHLQQS